MGGDLNKACTMPWCYAVVHFDVKMSRFLALFDEYHPTWETESPRQPVFLARSLATLGPSSVLVVNLDY